MLVVELLIAFVSRLVSASSSLDPTTIGAITIVATITSSVHTCRAKAELGIVYDLKTVTRAWDRVP